MKILRSFILGCALLSSYVGAIPPYHLANFDSHCRFTEKKYLVVGDDSLEEVFPEGVPHQALVGVLCNKNWPTMPSGWDPTIKVQGLQGFADISFIQVHPLSQDIEQLIRQGYKFSGIYVSSQLGISEQNLCQLGKLLLPEGYGMSVLPIRFSADEAGEEWDVEALRVQLHEAGSLGSLYKFVEENNLNKAFALLKEAASTYHLPLLEGVSPEKGFKRLWRATGVLDAYLLQFFESCFEGVWKGFREEAYLGSFQTSEAFNRKLPPELTSSSVGEMGTAIAAGLTGKPTDASLTGLYIFGTYRKPSRGKEYWINVQLKGWGYNRGNQATLRNELSILREWASGHKGSLDSIEFDGCSEDCFVIRSAILGPLLGLLKPGGVLTVDVPWSLKKARVDEESSASGSRTAPSGAEGGAQALEDLENLEALLLDLAPEHPDHEVWAVQTADKGSRVALSLREKGESRAESPVSQVFATTCSAIPLSDAGEVLAVEVQGLPQQPLPTQRISLGDSVHTIVEAISLGDSRWKLRLSGQTSAVINETTPAVLFSQRQSRSQQTVDWSGGWRRGWNQEGTCCFVENTAANREVLQTGKFLEFLDLDNTRLGIKTWTEAGSFIHILVKTAAPEEIIENHHGFNIGSSVSEENFMDEDL